MNNNRFKTTAFLEMMFESVLSLTFQLIFVYAFGEYSVPTIFSICWSIFTIGLSSVRYKEMQDIQHLLLKNKYNHTYYMLTVIITSLATVCALTFIAITMLWNWDVMFILLLSLLWNVIIVYFMFKYNYLQIALLRGDGGSGGGGQNINEINHISQIERWSMACYTVTAAFFNALTFMVTIDGLMSHHFKVRMCALIDIFVRLFLMSLVCAYFLIRYFDDESDLFIWGVIEITAAVLCVVFIGLRYYLLKKTGN